MANLAQRQKMIGIPVTKAPAGKTEKGTLMVLGYFTSDKRDEVGDIITREATERAIPKYRQWRNVRRMHMPDPVGLVRRIGTDDGLEWNEIEIEVIDPKAIFEVENGLLQALSVGILIDFDSMTPIDPDDPWAGFIINDYVLAEISLVDHPANYDASLLRNMPVEDTLRMVVRQYGLSAVATSMAKYLEVPMKDDATQKDVVETEPVEEPTGEPQAAEKSPACREEGESEEACVSRKIEEILEENPEMGQDQAAAIAEDMCQSACDEQDEPAEPPAEEGAETDEGKDLPAEEETSEEPQADEPDYVEELRTLTAELHSLAANLTDAVAALKTLVEAREADEQAEGDGAADEPQEGDKDLPAEEEAETETGSPVNRKGALPATELPDEQPAGDEPPADAKTGLRDALQRYLERR